MTNGEARLRELVAAMEHRVKSSMSRPHRGRPAEIAGWQYYFDDSCDRCQLEQALAAPVQAEVGAGACILTCRKCGIEYDIRSKGADRDFHSGLCYNAYHADGQADEAARPDVAGGVPPQWNIEQILVYIWQVVSGEGSSEQEYPYSKYRDSEGGKMLRTQLEGLASRGAFVQAEVGAGERALAQRIIDLPCIVEVRGPDVVGQIAELLAARPDVEGGGMFTDEHPYYSKGTMQALHRAMAESEKEGSK